MQRNYQSIQKFFLLLSLALLALRGQAITWYVAPTGNDGQDGTNWPTALATISNAIFKASETHTILVSNGVYTVTNTLRISKAITLRGLNGAAETSINGGGSTQCVSIEAAATLEGFSVTNGRAALNGAGICIASSGAGAIVADCLIARNRAEGFSGGGLYAAPAATIRNCTIADNETTTANGGGLFFLSAAAVTTNCLITGNTATNSGSGYGGGVYGGTLLDSTIQGNQGYRSGGVTIDAAFGSLIVSNTGYYSGGIYFHKSTTLSNCQIIANSADQAGGIKCYGANTFTLRNCTIADNVSTNAASSSKGSGGGIVWEVRNNSALTLEQCVITSNQIAASGSAERGGGGIMISPFAATHTNYSGIIRDCTISGNQVARYFCAGGLRGFEVTHLSTVLVERCVITYNSAERSGGGANLGPGFVLRNCLIADNVVTGAAQMGGGLYLSSNVWIDACTVASNYAANGGGLYALGANMIRNTILYGNSASSGSNWTHGGSGMTYTNCCVAPTVGLTGTDNIAADPLFNNPISADYSLRIGSPCIDRGINDSWMDAATDLIGNPRLDRFRRRVDIGAYEHFPRGMLFIGR